MNEQKNNLSWILLHLGVIGLALTSLLTGLRIAALSRDEILHVSALLPQGALHGIHFYSAAGLLAVTLGYGLYRLFYAGKRKAALRHPFHRTVIRLGHLAMGSAVASGLLIYLGVFSSSMLIEIHFWSALAVLVYFVVHGGGHFVHYGVRALKKIVRPAALDVKKEVPIMLSVVAVGALLLVFSGQKGHQTLEVKPIPIETLIKIDGVADEAAWKKAESITVHTFGGANFENGESKVTLKAMQNGQEVYFHFTWEDPTKSMKHLPLVKTEKGWMVKEKGFYRYDEREFYEDKFAIMIAASCEPGASGSIHLGPNPLGGKPSNWHGRGYHYTTDGKVRDVWHWKAVRTNDMFMADDNFFGKPDVSRSGSRRYTAGYLADGKESGAYIMNWQWYTPRGITPKRLPQKPSDLAPFQDGADTGKALDWVVHWYNYDLYDAAKDNYPVGTVMPSVLYASNRMEGDRANVLARAQWHEGRWSLEAVRRIDTGSVYDVALHEGVCMWVSAFDHAQTMHTRHTLPIRLIYGGSND